VIQDPNQKLEPEKEFEETDIPQIDLYRSENNILKADEKDKLLTWIIQNSVDKTIEYTLPKRECPKCKTLIFEYNVSCHSCSYSFDQCIITGYPINTQTETISCSNCNKKALKEAWKEWIGINEKCPWCNSIQISYK